MPRYQTAWPLLATLLLLCASAHARLIDATCRISTPDGGRGTGVAFERSQGQVFILTNAHVANSQAVQVEFWHRGHQGRALSGRVVMRSSDSNYDVAVVAVPEIAFGEIVPPTIPMAAPGTRLPAGTPIMSVGCASGSWPTLFRGHILRYEGTSLYYTPPPANGRSGSGVLTEDGAMIVGVVFARSNDDSFGLAVSSDAVYRALGRTSIAMPRAGAMPAARPIAPNEMTQGGLFGGRCTPPGRQPQPQPQPGPAPGGGTPWPSLPPSGGVPFSEQATPPAPEINIGVDVGPIADAIRGSPEEQALRRRMIQAQAEHYEGLAAQAEQRRQRDIADALPLDALGTAGSAAMGRDWSGAGAALSGPQVGLWAGGTVATILAAAFGLKGLTAVVAKFGIAAAVRLALSVLHSRFTAPERNEANEVMEDLAGVVVEKQKGQKK